MTLRIFLCALAALAAGCSRPAQRVPDGDLDSPSDSDGTGPCTDACPAEGASECVGDEVRTCDERGGCLEWSEPSACAEGSTCDPESGTCREDCGDFCDPFSIVLLPDTQYYTEKLPDWS